MSEDQLLAAACVSFFIISKLIKSKRKRKKPANKLISRPLLKKKDVTDVINTFLLNDLLPREHSEKFQDFYSMSKEDFDFILNGIRSTITKRGTIIRKSCPPEVKLALTLRFLATGGSFTSLQYLFGVTKQSISKIIPEVCEAIIQLLGSYVNTPSTPAEWNNIAEKFEEFWNFPRCVGALDGKLIVLQPPVSSGGEQSSNKVRFSIVLMAVADADYNFTLVDIDCKEPTSNGEVIDNCELYKKILKNQLNLPRKTTLPGRNQAVPYVFLGDSAFTLEENIMKPFPGIHPRGSCKGVFNYRLSRARRVVENAFGVMCSVFRVLRKPMQMEPEKAKNIVMSIICLHNFLRRSKTSRDIYTPLNTFDVEVDGGIIPGNWRSDTDDIASFLNLTDTLSLTGMPDRGTFTAEETRQEFANYFCADGQVPWQNQYA